VRCAAASTSYPVRHSGVIQHVACTRLRSKTVAKASLALPVDVEASVSAITESSGQLADEFLILVNKQMERVPGMTEEFTEQARKAMEGSESFFAASYHLATDYVLLASSKIDSAVNSASQAISTGSFEPMLANPTAIAGSWMLLLGVLLLASVAFRSARGSSGDAGPAPPAPSTNGSAPVEASEAWFQARAAPLTTTWQSDSSAYERAPAPASMVAIRDRLTPKGAPAADVKGDGAGRTASIWQQDTQPMPMHNGSTDASNGSGSDSVGVVFSGIDAASDSVTEVVFPGNDGTDDVDSSTVYSGDDATHVAARKGADELAPVVAKPDPELVADSEPELIADSAAEPASEPATEPVSDPLSELVGDAGAPETGEAAVDTEAMNGGGPSLNIGATGVAHLQAHVMHTRTYPVSSHSRSM
jgi:hypothetical protein